MPRSSTGWSHGSRARVGLPHSRRTPTGPSVTRAIAWLLNLDAELELADPKHYRPSPAMLARIEQLRARMTLLLSAHDRVIGVDGSLDTCTEALAFCPTPSALTRIAATGLTAPAAPTLEVLRGVNSRAFCAELGQTLPGAQYVRDEQALQCVLASVRSEQGFVLKRDFGFAGREQRRVLPGSPNGALDASSLGFARRSFARGQGLQVEPWCERTHDFALHGYVLQGGRVLLDQPQAQVCDERGCWQHSAPLAPDALDGHELAALTREAERTGDALARAGYFGPFGIDAFRYRDGQGLTCFQPRCELNARFSMAYPRGLLEHARSVPDYPYR